MTTTTAQTLAPPSGRTSVRGGGVHRGWALMVVAGVLAAAANLTLLGAAGGGVAVVVVDGDHPAGTPVTALGTRVVTLDVEDPAALRLLTPQRLGEDLAEMVTATRLDDGELLRMGDLRSAVVDHRSAMSLPLEVGRAVAGTLARGDVVDVLAEVDDAVTVVASGVEVLDVLPPGDGSLVGGTGGYVATLAVDEAQALALASALRGSGLDVVRRGASGG